MLAVIATSSASYQHIQKERLCATLIEYAERRISQRSKTLDKEILQHYRPSRQDSATVMRFAWTAMSLVNPVPTADWANNGGYDSDSGLDILVPVGTKCICAADGIVEYAERGHTPWFEDTNLSTALFDPPHSVRIRLNNAIKVNGVSYRFIWYTHLFKVDSSILNKFEVPIKAGAPVGLTGIGNRVPHLHFGIVHDRKQSKWVSHKEVAKLIWGSGNPRARSEVAKGSFGPSVRELQKILTSVSKLEDNLEFDPKGIDGDFGDNTEKAVKAFQKSRNLPASGKADEATWKELTDGN